MGKFSTYRKRGCARASPWPLPPPDPYLFGAGWDIGDGNWYVVLNEEYPPGPNCYRFGYKLIGEPEVEGAFGHFKDAAYFLVHAGETAMEYVKVAWGLGYPAPYQASDWVQVPI
jgi:hypothetical protein